MGGFYMDKKKVMGFFGFIIVFILQNSYADHPTIGFSSEIAGPITTVSATTLPKGYWSIATRVEYVWFDVFSDSEFENFAEEGEEVHSTDYLLSPFLGVGYGVTDDLTLSLRIPYVLRNNIREGHIEGGVAEVHTHGDSEGLGDLTFFSQYRVLNKENSILEAALLFGFKFPAGTTDENDDDNERFESEHQPGSGSWDPLIGLAVTKRLGHISFDTNLLYIIVTEGTQSTDLGDLLNYNISVSYRLSGKTGHHLQQAVIHHDHTSHIQLVWDIILEANGEWRQKQEFDGTEDENSGSNLIYISPGIRVSMNNRWSGFLSIGFPIFQDLDGTQHETDLRVIFGAGIGF